jgi:phospholipid transport system substrate-binding protein
VIATDIFLFKKKLFELSLNVLIIAENGDVSRQRQAAEETNFMRKEQMNAELRGGRFWRSFMAVLTVIFLFLLAAVSPRGAHAGDEGPSRVIRTFNTTLLEAMKKAGELGYSGRYKLLDPVIKESFALSFMGAQSAGRYWKTMGQEEKSLLIRTYTDWTVATYAGRFDGYSGESFQLASESPPVKGTVTVVSKFVQGNNEVIDFAYMLRRLEGRWRIVDIRISGVSQLALTRAQFTGVLKEKGVEALIEMLREKIRGFSQSKKG